MAYDEALAERVRDYLGPLTGVVEKRMFSGLAFMLDGNMTVCVMREELMARLGEEAAEAALVRPGARVFDYSRRPIKTWILVDPSVIDDDESLGAWIDEAVDFARSLPPK